MAEDDPANQEETTEETELDLSYYRLISGAAYAFNQAGSFLDELTSKDIQPTLQAEMRQDVQDICKAVEHGMSDPENPANLLLFSRATCALIEHAEDAMIAIEEANNAETSKNWTPVRSATDQR